MCQGSFAAAIGPDETDAVAALDADGKTLHHRRRIALGEAFRFNHQGAGTLRSRDRHYGLAAGPADVATLLPQRLEPGDAAHIALASCRDAVAHPVLFGLDLAIELHPIALLFGEDIVAPRLELRKAVLDAARP